MKTRIIHTKIWEDSWFTSISRTSGWIFLFLISCPQNGLSGIFEIPDRILCFSTRTTQSELEKSKKELEGRVVFYKGWVKILHSDKYNNYITNPKMEVALEKEMKLIPKEILEYVNGYDTSIHTSIYTPNNHKSEIINNKSIKEESVRETKPTDEDMQQIADKYGVPLAFVLSKWDDVCNWEAEKPGRMRGRNWKMTLMNWVKRDGIKIKQGGQNGRTVIDARGLK